MNNVILKKLLDTLNMAVMIILITHLLACFWLLIGLKGHMTNEEGWVTSQISLGRGVSIEFGSLYVVSIHYIITSFSSVGYGEVLSTTIQET